MINSTSKIENDYKYLSSESFKDIYTTKNNPNAVKFYMEGVHCSGCLSILVQDPLN